MIKFRGDPSRMNGVIEVRGIVNKDGTISYGEFTQYDNEFGKFNFFIKSILRLSFLTEEVTNNTMLTI